MTVDKADLEVSRFFAQAWRPVEMGRFLMRGGYVGFAVGGRPRL